MGQIRILPTQLVNKIAAGEVVERPASVVKELVENAIDAGATRIEAAVENGGKKLISVTDNGSGMTIEDLTLAFAPHATSKLEGDEDLTSIDTMGFRGEALASIASISHAQIRTRRREDQNGHEIASAGGKIDPPRPCATGPGTTVVIRDLFYNTPARQKFLRTTNTELGHISEQLTRLALPHPHIAFALSHNGRTLQDLPAAETTIQRSADIFGKDLAESLIPLVCRSGPVGVNGLIGVPSAARATGKWQYFFLNGRYIRDRVLSHALREAYRGLVEPSRFPVALVFLRVDPAEVDVNVHPTKIEVRFRDSQAVHGSLLAALKETLNKASLAPSASIADRDDGAQANEFADEHRQSLRQALADFFKSAPPAQPKLAFPDHARSDRAGKNLQRADFELTPPAPPAGYSPRGDLPSVAPDQTGQLLACPAIQIHNSYIVAASEDGMEIIDQHALHERLIYNDLKRRLTEADSSGLTSQRMLIPETLSVTKSEAASLEDHSSLLSTLGVEVVPFGPSAVAVQQFPSLLAEKGVVASEFIRDALDILAEDESADGERLLEDLLEIMACKAAVKAGDALSPAEIDSLLARRAEAEKSSACPHGRPTTVKLTMKDLAKQFKRT